MPTWLNRRHVVWIAAWAVVALVASMSAAIPVRAQDGAQNEDSQQRPEPWIRSPHDACPEGIVPPTDLEDVTAAWYDEDVVCALWYGITSGTSETEFDRNGDVTRGQMATFIANVIDYAAEDGVTHSLPEYDGENRFSDAGDSVHVENINRLTAAGIVQGGPAGRGQDEFGPGLRVRRDQMATFLNGAQGFMAGDAFASDNDFFDRDDGNVHEDNINAIAEHGLTGGTSAAKAANYAPRAFVERQHMASFLMRLVDIHVAARRVQTPLGRTASSESFAFREVPDTAEVSAAPIPGEGGVQFAVVGLEDEVISLAMFDCHDLFRVGATTFRDHEDPAGEADLTVDSDGAVIESVDGRPRVDPDNYVSDVEPGDDGEITFRVDSTTADCTVGAAFVDANDNDGLDVDDAGTPTEAFATAKPLLFVPAEDAGPTKDATVLFIDRSGHTFVADDGAARRTFVLDDLDSFAVDERAISFAEFTARLSPGDRISAEASAEDGKTTFHLDDAAPTPPNNVTATWERPEVVLTWTHSATPTVGSYRIDRHPCLEPHEMEGREPPWEVIAEVDANHTSVRHAITGRGHALCMVYRVHPVDHRDVSPPSDDASAEVTVHGFRVLDAALMRDAGEKGVADAGDQHRFITDLPMELMDPERPERPPYYEAWRNTDATPDDYIGYEHVRIPCTVRERDVDPDTTDCILNADDVMISGETYGPNQVITVNLGNDVYVRDVPPRYPALLTDPFLCCDVHGNRLDTDNSDMTIDR